MDIIQKPIEEEAKQSYLDYAMSVIVGRAIPDIKDGLKPVQRRILYAMYEMDLFPEKPFKKSARIVGDTMGRYHPHGDQAIYDALVRMAQSFNMRYPLIIGQGNFGSIDGDPPAAMRYSEAKLSKVAVSMLEDIENQTIVFIPNFDESTLEPLVLPSKFPNLLCNGSAGIAVGLATSIPPHNVTEISRALIELAKNENLTLEEILKYIKGPDFPTGGIIINPKQLYEAYETGKGQVTIQAKAHIEKVSGNKEQIIITEIPYMVNKAELIKKIADLAREGKLKEISDLRDESDKEGIRIVIELKRDAKGTAVLNKLYKHTSLRKNFPINMVVLIDLEPKLVGLKRALLEFIKHRLEVIYKRTQFFLKKANSRLHIVEGLIIAISNLDKAIDLIRSSKTAEEARQKLIESFNLTETQANAVLDLRLQRLTSLEREKLETEQKELKEKIAYYEKVLSDKSERIKIFIEEQEDIIKRFGDPRRTSIVGEKELSNKRVQVFITKSGRIIPQGKENHETNENNEFLLEEIVDVLELSFEEGLFLVSNKARVYWIAGEGSLSGSKASFKDADEFCIGAFVRESFDKRIYMFSKKGFIKKLPLADFEYKNQGMSIMKLEEDDELVSITGSGEESFVLLITKMGYILKVKSEEISPSTVNSKGVIGIKLKEKDEGVSVRTLKDEKYILLITKKGFLKAIDSSLVLEAQRGSLGKKILSLEKEDELIDAIGFNDSLSLMLSLENGKVFFEFIESSFKEKRLDLKESFLARVEIK